MSKSSINFSLIVLFSWLIFSCAKKIEEIPPTYSLKPSGEYISFPLDDQTSNISMGLEYYSGQKPLLFSSNPITNSLQIYDLEGQKLEEEIFFEKEGDQAMVLGHFHVQSLDSIFVFPEWKPEFFLTDTSGKVKKTYKYQLPPEYAFLFVHNSYYVSTPQIHGKELVARIRGNFNVTNLSAEELGQKSLMAAINLETGETRILPQKFPQDYLTQGLKQLEFSVAPWGNGVAVSIMGDHQIYFAESIDSVLQSKQAASQFLDQTMPTFAKDAGGMEYSQYFFGKSKYESLVYDPFRKVYYRLAFPTVQATTEKEIKALRSNPGPFGILVLDEEFNVLTEKKFEAGTYLPSNFFVGEKGLYLSKSHPANPNLKEDQMVFELIELETSKE